VLLIFGHGKKEKTAGKAALCLKIFTCILSDLMIDYRYVARHGCLPDALRVVSGAIPQIQGLK
jgi:hypothetical protein